MNIRSSTLNTTRRTLPIRDPVQVRDLRSVEVDSFQPAPSAPLATKQAALNVAPAQSSKGGFFSRLFGGLKKIAAGWLGQASGWLTKNVGGLITKAQTWASDTVGGLLTKAATWFQNLIAKWQGKLAQ